MGAVRRRTHEGPGRLPGVPEAVTAGKQSPGEANKLFGVNEGTALGVGEAAEKTRRQRPAPSAPPGALGGPRGPAGSAAAGFMTTQQGLFRRLPNNQVSSGVTPS